MSKGNRTRRREKGLLPAPVKCIAHNRHGEPCKNSPINGATVCRWHGAAAHQVRRKAEERIAAAADPAAAKLVELMSSRKVPYAVQLAAAKDLLDRAGVGRERPVTVELALWQQNLGDLVVDLPPGDDDIVDGEVVENTAPESPPPHDYDNVTPLHGDSPNADAQWP